MGPLVSIALCTYNGASYLSAQLDSILAQTYTNLQIVIVDDASTDGTYNIVQQYAGKDKRIIYFANETNLGFNKNFEKAVKLSTGEFIAISDQDDVWELNKIQRLIDSIGSNWLAFSNSSLIYDNGSIKAGKLLSKFRYGRRNYRSILLGNFVTGHTCLMSREFLQYILPFPDAGYYDWWMGFIALYHNKLVYLKETLTQYRLHENSVTQLEHNNKQPAAINYNYVMVMLQNFLSYRHLTAADRKFLTSLRKAYSNKNKFNILLTYLIGVNYKALFPNLKDRGLLSAFNFARKIVHSTDWGRHSV